MEWEGKLTSENWICGGGRKFVCGTDVCGMSWQTMNRLQSEHPASLRPVLHTASPWQFTCPADTMRFVKAGQLPLSRCAQPPLRRWDMRKWLWWVFGGAFVLLNALTRCIDCVLTNWDQILNLMMLENVFFPRLLYARCNFGRLCWSGSLFSSSQI